MTPVDEFLHRDNLYIILMYQEKTPTTQSQIRWVRHHAFYHSCRNDDVQTMIDSLIAPMRLLALTERLTS